MMMVKTSMRRSVLVFLLLLVRLRSATALSSLTRGRREAVCLLSLCPAVAAAAQELTGAKLFERNCAVCHAGGGNLIDRSKSLDRAALDENGYDRQAIELIIAQGRNAMPGFGCAEGSDACGKALDAQDIQAVADYVEVQADNAWPP
mmetsp:Transcript_29974/g.96714  ORF Transcript_29974/g.96714 Transcript_29974/m.96714 type:complete len:147 (+) Transcript_29974:103-543(+)